MMLGILSSAAGLFGGSGILRIGLGIGSAVAMYLLGGQGGSHDNRLDDLKVSSSTYGKGLPIVYGTMRCSGNMFWSTDFVEEKHYFNSKGKDITGKKKDDKKGQRVYEYFANFAIALCEGPVDEVLRIWADSNLIYDKYNPDNEDLVGPGFSQETEDGGGGKFGKGGGKSAGGKKGHSGGDSGRFGFRFYSGSKVQLPDPFMVETEGADKTPAYRDVCYLFFEKLALQDFGNRIPTITAEVSVLKERAVTYQYCRPLIESDVIPANNTVRDAYVDPNRYRLYIIGNGVDGRMVRTYDLASFVETNRGYLTGTYDVPAYNGLGHFIGMTTVNLGSLDIAGLSHDGDLIGAAISGNSEPVFFIDPNTLTPRYVFGAVSADLGNDDDSVQNIDKATALVAVEVDPLSGSTETILLTAIVSQFGDLSFFKGTVDEGYQYNYQNAEIGGSSHKVVPGLPTIGASYFYVIANDNKIYRCKTQGVPITGTEHGQENTAVVIYQGDIVAGVDVSYGISDPFVVIGAECLGLIETLISADPKRQGTWAVKLDPITGETLWRKRIDTNTNIAPGGTMQLTPILSGNKMMWMGTAGSSIGTCYEIDFRTEEVTSFSLPAGFIQPDSFQAYWPLGGYILMGGVVDDDSEFDGEWTLFLARVDRLSQVKVGIKDIFIDMCKRVGVPDAKISVAALNDEQITGYIIEEPTPARSVLEDLIKIFLFDIVESDYTLKAISRGSDIPLLTITEEQLGVVNADLHEAYKETTIQAIDCPATCDVSYVNPDEDYKNGTQHYRRPISPMPVMSSRDILTVALPMAMKPDRAKQLAQKILLSIWAERTTYDTLLPWTYLKYDPADIIAFQMSNGFEVQLRMYQMDIGADYTISAAGVAQFPGSYNSDILAVEPGGIIKLRKQAAPVTFPFIFDTPYLSDADVQGSGGFDYYWGAGGYTAGLKYAALERRLSPGEWTAVDATAYETVYGVVVGNIPDPPNGPFATDDTTELLLAPAHRFNFGDQVFEWESIPDAEWPSEQNMIIVGEEVILFKDAEVLDNGRVKLTTLIRGWRGTEQYAYLHGGKFSEQFAVVTENSLRTTPESLDLINNQFQFKTLSPGLLINLPVVTRKTLTGGTLRPYAPAYFNRVADTPTAGDIRITWARRTRYGGGLKNGTGVVPLNEESELYEVYILSEPYDEGTFDPADEDTYVRTYSGITSPQVDYTAAQQITDGFTEEDNLYVVVFQISAQVGRGFPGHDILYASIFD